jgi:hypothetical protein
MKVSQSMRRPTRRHLLGALSGLGLGGTLVTTLTSAPDAAHGASEPLNLGDPWGNLEGYLKARSDISGEQSVTWRTGTVRSFIPGRRSRLLLQVHNLKCTRCYKDATGYEFLERECLIFSDPATGQPLTSWFNPFTERTVEVFQLQNASAGRHIDADGPSGPFRMDYIEHSGDVTFFSDLLYASPSALDMENYAPYSASNTYEGAGIYNYQAKRDDLDNPDLSSVTVTVSHTGVRQWLPWMEMGAWAGGVIVPSRGKKLTRVEEVPQPFLGWLERNSPEFLEAPTLADKDNQKFYYQNFREHIDTERARKKGTRQP